VTAFFDSHCHIDLPVFDEDRLAVVLRALDAGVHAQLVIGYNPQRWQTTAMLCGQYPFMLRSAGLHPNDAAIWSDEIRARLVDELRSGEPIAIGETGLDFFRDHANPEMQRQAFRAQLQLAREFDLPVIIHQRAAEGEVLAILREFAPLSGVMHCFSGDSTFARQCLEIGFHLGIGGVVTYPRSTATRDALATIPLERIIMETDAPFLAPQSRRGKRNEPALLVEAADIVADAHGKTRDDVARVSTANAIQLFGDSVGSALAAGQEARLCPS
jgi:TatD DNase family protein